MVPTTCAAINSLSSNPGQDVFGFARPEHFSAREQGAYSHYRGSGARKMRALENLAVNGWRFFTSAHGWVSLFVAAIVSLPFFECLTASKKRRIDVFTTSPYKAILIVASIIGVILWLRS
jgi:hypothetical protein